jgi:hypothetical protein
MLGGTMKEPESWKRLPAGFGDRVRVRRAPETEAAGLAGRSGIVYGITTVSITGVAVVGEPEEDTAINVFFEDSGEGVWLAPPLVEFVDHNPGTTVAISGVPKEWTRNAAGEWVVTSRTLPLAEWPARIRGILRKLFGR